MTEAKLQEQNQKSNFGLLIENTIRALDSEAMEKSTALKFSAEFWKERVGTAKKKYPELNKYLDSELKNALKELVKDFVIANVEKMF
jgi:hypothetical protein